MTGAGGMIAELASWLLTEGRSFSGTGPFEEALIEKLRRTGLPVARFTTGVPSLHPQVDSFSTLWEEDTGITFRQFRMDPEVEQQLRNSAIYTAYQGGKTVRCPLDGPPQEGEYDILADLRAAGYTDYLVLPLPFSDGSNKAVSFATKRAGGFTEEQVEVLEGIRDTLAAAMEIHYLRHMARTLVRTYIGPQAGDRVLAGAIKRGVGETIRAVIWFSDLRGFTELSTRLARDDVIALLNDYFGAVSAAVESAGGEILKFIGDAVLAIFPLSREEDPGATAGRAYHAARETMAAVAALNRERQENDQPLIRQGIALHIGDVMFGNVGGESRLDFTVVGPAVNLASRLESLCGELGEALLASADFVTVMETEGWRRLGEFPLKGFDAPQPAFAPRSRRS